MKSSPAVSPEEYPNLKRKRSSHLLTRQKAIEEKRGTDSKQSSEKSEAQTVESQLSDEDEMEKYLRENIRACNTSPDLHSLDFGPLQAYSPAENLGCAKYNSDSDSETKSAFSSFRRRRKYGNTLEVPTAVEDHKITAVDHQLEIDGRTPRILRVQSMIEYERRSRIKKLQSDLQLIQKDLQDLDDLEYQVSIV